MAAPPTDSELAARARDAVHTALGFGVLAVQRLQVGRRDLTKDVAERVAASGGVATLVRQAQVLVDPVLDSLEGRLPPTTRVVMRQARRAARGVQDSVLKKK